MPLSREEIVADEDETTPLVRVAQAAPAASASMEEVAARTRRKEESMEEVAARTRREEESMEEVAARTRRQEEYLKSLARIVRVPPAPFPWWRRLPFLGPTGDCVAVGQPLYPEQVDMLRRSRTPGHFKLLALDRQLAMECLDVYNSSHPLNEYEPAPGKMTKYFRFHNGTYWIHGNFVARRKRSGWLSFLLPAPRTLFFFEISNSRDSRDVVTCTPLDEPVTEAYSVLGFPLGFSKRRSGKLDTICRTCSCRFYLPHPGIQRKHQCVHDNARRVCAMCYNNSVVLHPDLFHFGIPDP
ncbi:hypothetical protein ACP4OV_021746 [Aristida adscensionis]